MNEGKTVEESDIIIVIVIEIRSTLRDAGIFIIFISCMQNQLEVAEVQLDTVVACQMALTAANALGDCRLEARSESGIEC